MLPTSMSASNQQSTELKASQNTRGSSEGGSGFRNSQLINFALGGSSLEASASDSSGNLPWWGWVLLAAGIGGLLWYAAKKG